MADLPVADSDDFGIVDDNGNKILLNTDGSVNQFALSKISTNNSSTTPLGSSGVFTGTSEDVTKYTHVTVSIYTDQASATDGLSIQFSTDGSNWDHIDIFSIPANIGKTFTVQRSAQYFRVVYTNGTSAQSVFRLQVLLNAAHGKPSTHRIQDMISNDDGAELVKSILTGLSPDGTFINAKVSSGGALRVESTVTAPAESTVITKENFADIATTSGTDTIYTITNGETLTIQLISAGSEASTGGSVTELFEDPNGDLSVLNRIETVFNNGDSASIVIDRDFVGDGTRRIVMRQRGYTSAAREMFGRWQGFEE